MGEVVAGGEHIIEGLLMPEPWDDGGTGGCHAEFALAALSSSECWGRLLCLSWGKRYHDVPSGRGSSLVPMGYTLSKAA